MEPIQWNPTVTKRTAEPLVREFSEPWTSNAIKNQFFHYKTHFGIIIKQDTKFTMTIETRSTIENLYFYCLTDSLLGTFLILDLQKDKNSTKCITTTSDCVPMISVSHNVPAVITIETSHWIPLPIFDSEDVTFVTSETVEFEFYKNVQIYGFVENYYTQMLLSTNDIINLKTTGCSLYLGLQTQTDVIEYYDYLTENDNYLNDSVKSSSINRAMLFIRSEQCYNECSNNSSETYFSPHYISVIGNIETFLHPAKGASWILLQKFAEYYNKKENIYGFGETFNLWNDIFATLYQQKYRNKELVKYAYPYTFVSTFNYEEGVFLEQWDYEEKLILFISLFGYDGTDTPLKEFRVRYLSRDMANPFTGFIHVLLEMFLDSYDINLLPFLSKVINFKQCTIPLLSPVLELRLLSGRPIMPAIDFNINLSELQVQSMERDLREISPLMLLKKIRKMYFEVEFKILSPVDLNGICLYLNNECQNITEHVMKLNLALNVYSVHIVKEIGSNLYISKMLYHTVSKNMTILVEVIKVDEYSRHVPFVNYFFEFQGYRDITCLQLFINYNDMTIRLKQLEEKMHHLFKNDLYFSISVKRNDCIIFEYKFIAWLERKEGLVDVIHKFQVNDTLNIYHVEPDRFKLNSIKYGNAKNNNFLFTNIGLHNIEDSGDFKIYSHVIKELDKFNKNHDVDLSYNAHYQISLTYYANVLISKGMEKDIPRDWIES